MELVGQQGSPVDVLLVGKAWVPDVTRMENLFHIELNYDALLRAFIPLLVGVFITRKGGLSVFKNF